ncbi:MULTISPECIES: hypothetical protein [Calothrix]|uniref:Uncharacterized protein n=2 Tax=Calothrix TaxID=1186 RepID=A0ABR8AFP3_9CYAN|nr:MULTISPECIES: hypothetical protein [Calothrix]MBD2198315.1 hypothetical protein [Calothrix parietina FACHB-288]MBD2226640.1 hypothetical protein [Calothrix anomala FACHB-343]
MPNSYSSHQGVNFPADFLLFKLHELTIIVSRKELKSQLGCTKIWRLHQLLYHSQQATVLTTVEEGRRQTAEGRRLKSKGDLNSS